MGNKLLDVDIKSVKIKVRLLKCVVKESDSYSFKLHLSRSFLIVESINYTFTHFDSLKGSLSTVVGWWRLGEEKFTTTICVPSSVYCYLKNIRRKTGYSFSILVNFLLYCIVTRLNCSPSYFKRLSLKKEKWSSDVKRDMAVFQLIYGFKKRNNGGCNPI